MDVRDGNRAARTRHTLRRNPDFARFPDRISTRQLVETVCGGGIFATIFRAFSRWPEASRLAVAGLSCGVPRAVWFRRDCATKAAVFFSVLPPATVGSWWEKKGAGIRWWCGIEA